MIAVICSTCCEGILGLDENNCTFQDSENVRLKQFFKLTAVGWASSSLRESVHCPNCGTKNIIQDIIKAWTEERNRRNRTEQRNS